MNDDNETPLADHPGPGGPKAGDPAVNQARDAKHYAQNHPGYAALDTSKPAEAVRMRTAGLPDDAPPVIAWKKFMASGGYEAAISQFDLFLAGWTARDSQPS